MTVNESSDLVRQLAKRLGRELTPSEERLLLLAEEIIEREKRDSESQGKAIGASE